MIVSPKRIEANRRNAQKSTGPKTPEGKAVARRNALKHGLTALIVQAEDSERLLERANDFHPAHRPQNRWQEWLSEEIALLTVRIDRVERMERKAREKLAWRAYMFWDEDRRVAVERVAARLRLDPIGVVGELTASPQGCDWLVSRWAMLAALADRGAWTDEQRALAHDLLGTPPEARSAPIGLLVDEFGRRIGPDRAEAEVAREAIDAIRDRRGPAEEADEIDRHLTQADLNDAASAELGLLRRYEATLHRRLRWLAQQVQLKPAAGPVLSWFKPDFLRKPENLDRPAVETPVGDPTPRTHYEMHVVETYRRLFPDPPAEAEVEAAPAPEVASRPEAAPAPEVVAEPEADRTTEDVSAQNTKTDPLHNRTEPLSSESLPEVSDRTPHLGESPPDRGERKASVCVAKPSRSKFPPYEEAEESTEPMDWGDGWEPVPDDELDKYPPFDWAAHVANQIRFEREAEAAASR